MSKWVFISAILFASSAYADVLVAARTVRSQAIITAADVMVKDADIPGSLTLPAQAIGQEARVVLYAGRPIRPANIGPATIIKRNQIIMLVYQRGSLRIVTDARSLGRGGVGDFIRVMNLTSRSTVTGIVGADGTVTVGY